MQKCLVDRLRAAGIALFALVLAVSAVVTPIAASNTMDIQVLDVSDWHAQLDPINVPDLGDVGGAAVLSAYFKRDRQANPNTLTLTAGDAFGAAPPLSGFFNEETGVKAMRLMGIDVDTFGNHNFDRGTEHLQQMVRLAAAKDEVGKPFSFVAANLKGIEKEVGDVLPYKVFTIEPANGTGAAQASTAGRVKVAVVGITNPEAPTLVFPGNFGDIKVEKDIVKEANKAAKEARKDGAAIVIAITHLGITTQKQGTDSGDGPLVAFGEAVDGPAARGFDIVFGDHTDFKFEKTLSNGVVLIENKSKGRTYSKTTLTYDFDQKRVTRKVNQFVDPLKSGVTPDPAVESMLAPYRTLLAAQLDSEIGVATARFPRGGSPAVERIQEVAVGNLVADAIRQQYASQIAITNGGGLRSPLPSSYLPQDTTLRRDTPGYAAGPPYDLVTGDVFTLLPFGNSVVTRTVTGAQLHAALEHSVGSIPAANGKFLQISGFRFKYDATKPAGSRVWQVQLENGTAILANSTTYTLATNDFTNTGGDGFTMLADGQGVTREVMADVVLLFIRGKGTITPTVDGRITNEPK